MGVGGCDLMKELHKLVGIADKLYDGQVEFVLDEGVFKEKADDVEDNDESAVDVFFFITPNGGLYKNAKIKFSMYVRLDACYSSSPPSVKCLNRIYHPNIKSRVCVNADWEAGTGLQGIIMSILYLFYHPNLDDAYSVVRSLNGDYEAFAVNVGRSLRGEVLGDGYEFDKLLEDEIDSEERGGDAKMDIAEEEEAGSIAQPTVPTTQTETTLGVVMTPSVTNPITEVDSSINLPVTLDVMSQSYQSKILRSHFKARTNEKAGRMTRRSGLTQTQRGGLPWTLRSRRRYDITPY